MAARHAELLRRGVISCADQEMHGSGFPYPNTGHDRDCLGGPQAITRVCLSKLRGMRAGRIAAQAASLRQSSASERFSSSSSTLKALRHGACARETPARPAPARWESSRATARRSLRSRRLATSPARRQGDGDLGGVGLAPAQPVAQSAELEPCRRPWSAQRVQRTRPARDPRARAPPPSARRTLVSARSRASSARCASGSPTSRDIPAIVGIVRGRPARLASAAMRRFRAFSAGLAVSSSPGAAARPPASRRMPGGPEGDPRGAEGRPGAGPGRGHPDV